MKNQISISLSLFAAVLFSPEYSGLFTQAKAQCVANWNGWAAGCMVDFINTSTGTNNNTTYNWNFGDGQTATLPNKVYTYSVSGTYTVCLTIVVTNPSSGQCKDTLCKPVTVTCATGMASYPQIDLSLSVNNPVFSFADIHYSIPSSGNIKLVLFDIVGNKIGVLENGNKNAGMHSYLLNTGGFSKGIYFIHLNFEGATITKKIIIAE